MNRSSVEWDESLAVGEASVDAQHRGLIEMIGGIPTNDPPTAEEYISKVEDYAATHFCDEEELMARIGYPGLDDQRRKHKKYATILKTYKRECLEGKRDVFQFKHFLICWIRDHIMQEDKKIGEFLRKGS